MNPRTWTPDPSHYPEQMTPLSATVWFDAIGIGLHAAARELGAPFGGFEARTELGWAYEGDREPDWQIDLERFRAAALGLPERWERELMPRSHAISTDLHRLRPEAVGATEAMASLDRFWELVLEQWTIHFLAVVPAQAAIELFTDAYAEAFGPSDHLAPYRSLDRLPNESTGADLQLWKLAQRSTELGVGDVLREYPPDLAVERLRELEHGRRFLGELDGYLERFGGRARWHELSLPREAERPTMTLEGIRLFLESGSAPTVAGEEEGRRREAEILARAPGLSEVLPAAKFGYAIKEGHVYHIDYPGLLATREVLLGYGRRLLAEGRLGTLDDVWMLRRDELRSAVDPRGDGRPLEPLVEERRRELQEGLRQGPRPFLGRPPDGAERHALLEKFYGRGGRDPAEFGAAALGGTGASPGVAEGPARVITGPEGFERVRPGDVLVTTTTTPAWTPLFPSLAALVTETGGVLCHAAIVAREYGLPAVVGVPNATRRIPDGAATKVDGATGEVRILDR